MILVVSEPGSQRRKIMGEFELDLKNEENLEKEVFKEI
jgi:hypothetical protein